MKKHIYISVILLTVSVMSAFAINNTISGGDYHGVVICAKGEVYAWGSNSGNKLALAPPNNAISQALTPRKVNLPAGLTFSQVTSKAGGHILALSCRKTVYAWGANMLSQCGLPTATNPVNVPNLISKGQTPGHDINGNPGGDYLGGVKYVTCTCAGSLAILEDKGQVVGWGGNYNQGGVSGQWLPGTTATPVYINRHVSAGGGRLENVIHVAAGNNNVIFLVDDEGTGSGLGTVYTIGNWDGHGDENLITAKPVLRTDNRQPLTNVRMVGGMTIGGFALDAEGYVWGWGQGWGCATGTGKPDGDAYADKVLSSVYGAISNEEFLTDVKDIVGGQTHGLAITKEGYVLSWGSATFPPNSALGCGASRFLNYCDGNRRVDDAVYVSSGDQFSFMINDKNEYYSIGQNANGQLGINSTTNQLCFAKINIPCTPIDPCPEVFIPTTVHKCPDKPVDLNIGFAVPTGIEYRYYFKWSRDGVDLNSATLEETRNYCWERENPRYETCGCGECDEEDLNYETC